MNMKNIFKSLAALFLGCAMSAVSCQKPEEQQKVTPEFPSVVEDFAVAPGSTITLTFNVNMDWSLSVSDSNIRWFWIDDNSIKVDKVSGKVAQEGTSEAVTVKIGVSDTEEFDQNRTCDVTLTMGGESKVIAKYMRPAKERTMTVFAAKVENGTFVLDEEGGYVYAEAQVSEIDLIWSPENADFRMPVKVTANCDWTVAAPSWLDFQEPDKTDGIVELVFSAASFEAVTGKVAFKTKDSDAVMKEIQVSAPSCAVVDLYAVQVDENGELAFNDEGDYLYTEEPVDAFTLVWPGQDYRMPVKVDAKCNWEIELPNWLTARYADETVLERAGVLEFTFLGDPRYYPLEDATADIVFKYDGKTVKTVAVTIPGIKDKFSYGVDMNMTAWEFNASAELLTTIGYQAIPASAWMFGTEDACVMAVEMKDGKRVADAPQWLKVEVQAFVDGEDVLQRRTVSVTPSANDGAQREAYVIFCDKAYDQADYFNTDGSVKEDKKKFMVNLLQHGSDMDYITMLASESEMASAGVTFEVNSNPRLEGYFGATKYKYTLTYSNQYARDKGYMSLAKPYASYKVFDGVRKDQTANADFWLKFTSDAEDRKSGVVDMYLDMTPSETKTSGYVVFYAEDGSTLAIVECVFDPVVVVETVVVEFTEQSAQYAQMTGATLEHVTSGPIYDQFSEGMHTVYHLTYRMEGMPLKVKIPSSVKKHNVNPYSYRTFFKVNNLVYDEYFGPNDLLGEVETDGEGAVEIYMNRPDTQVQIGNIEMKENTYMSVINFVDKADGIVFVLVCTLDLSE